MLAEEETSPKVIIVGGDDGDEDAAAQSQCHKSYTKNIHNQSL